MSDFGTEGTVVPNADHSLKAIIVVPNYDGTEIRFEKISPIVAWRIDGHRATPIVFGIAELDKTNVFVGVIDTNGTCYTDYGYSTPMTIEEFRQWSCDIVSHKQSESYRRYAEL